MLSRRKSREMRNKMRQVASMLSHPILWHVNCGHVDENGCYGRESTNNETAAGDSRLCRDHPTTAATSSAWSIPCPVALSCNSHHLHETHTDHHGRYAGPARHSSSG